MRRYCYLITIVFFFSICNFGRALSNESIAFMDCDFFNNYNLSDAKNVKQLWDTLHLAATLQGIVNRDKPRFYIRYVRNQVGLNVDDYWWNKYRAKGEWLAERDVVQIKDIYQAVEVFRRYIKGAVVYDPNVYSTSNIASAVSGIENLISVRYDNSPGSVYDRLVNDLKIPVKVWLVNRDGSSKFTGRGIVPETNRKSSASKKIDPYIWFIEKYLKKGLCNTKYAAYYIDQYWMQDPSRAVANHHQLTNHDFFVSKRAFFFDLSPWEDEAATDDSTQEPGLDNKILREMLLLAYKQNKGEDFCYIGGFPAWAFKYTKHAGGRHEDVPTEWEFSRIISAYNAFKDADAIGLGALANSSFWQHFPLEKSYPQKWISRSDLKKRGYIDGDGRVDFKDREFVIFYVGDFDASSWISQTASFLWDDPSRGKVPLMWCISPVLSERVPMVMHYFRKSASDLDYFAAADNGAGYLMPGMLQEPRPISGLPDGLEAWGKHCKKFYERWGLSITGFIIDGSAPKLNDRGFKCYSKFSPNGIVPQKVPLTLLFGDMPILRSDCDIVSSDPKIAAEAVLDRIDKRPIPFHWFRAILKSPTWYKNVYEQLKNKNKKIEFLDAPTFFELYRIYLEQNKAAAAGEINI